MRPRRMIQFSRAPARLGPPRLPPPPVFPPSEKGAHSGAFVRTAAARREGGSLAAATRGRDRSACRSRGRGSCCALPDSQQSGSSRTIASRGNPPPDRRGEQWWPARSCRTLLPLGIGTCHAGAPRRAGAASVCSCNPWTNKKRHDLTTEIMALMPSGYHLGCKTKAPNDSPFSRSNHLALALTRWFWLWLIFTIDSRLHSLQYSGKSVSTVVGRTRCCVGRPHNGQINFPSADTNSISRRFSDCKSFCRSFPVFIYCFKSKYRY